MLKNIEYRLNKNLPPKEVKLDVYKEALEYYLNLQKGGLCKYDGGVEGGLGLCLILPTLMWNLNSYLENLEIDGETEYWSYRDTEIAFPEISSWVRKIRREFNNSDRITLRIDAMRDCINRLSS